MNDQTVSYKLFVNGCSIKSIITITDNEIEILKDDKEKETINTSDIITIEEFQSEREDTGSSSTTLHLIQKTSSPRWRKDIVKFSGDKVECETFSNVVRNKLNEEIRCHRPNKLFVIINPIGGMKQGEQIFTDTVNPLLKLAGVQTEVVVSQYHRHIEEIIETTDFDPYDGIVFCGGDGTYYQGMNALFKKTQVEANVDHNNPEIPLKIPQYPIGIIPTGSGNTIAQIAHGCWDIETSVLHIIRGRINSLGVTGVYSGDKWLSYASFAVEYGHVAEMFHYMESFRWLKAHRYRFAGLIPRLQNFRNLQTVVLTSSIPGERFQITTGEERNSEMESPLNKEEEKEMIEGQFHTVFMMTGDFFTDDYRFAVKPVDYKSSNLLLYKQSSRLELLNHYMNMLYNRDPNMFKRDYIVRRKISGFKIKVKSLIGGNTFLSWNAELPKRIMIDGEIVELPKQEWEARFLGRLIPVFSSMDQLGTLKL